MVSEIENPDHIFFRRKYNEVHFEWVELEVRAKHSWPKVLKISWTSEFGA